MRRALGVDEQDTRWEKDKRGYSGGFGHAAMYRRPCKGEVDFKNSASEVYYNDTIPLAAKILMGYSIEKNRNVNYKSVKISKKALICKKFQREAGKELKKCIVLKRLISSFQQPVKRS